MDLISFITETVPAVDRSPLREYLKEIDRLREDGYSWPQVTQYLNHHGVHLHENSVREWWTRRQKGRDGLAAPIKPNPGGAPPAPPSSLPARAQVPREPLAPAVSKQATGQVLDELMGECSQHLPGLATRPRFLP